MGKRWWDWMRGRRDLGIIARENVSVTPFDTGGFCVRYEDFDGQAHCRVLETWQEAVCWIECNEPRLALADQQFPPERIECRVCEADEILRKMEAVR